MTSLLKDATARPWNNGRQEDGGGWRVENDTAGSSAHWTIGSGKKTVAIAVTTEHYKNSEFEANARLIVTAVNAYEPMLAALEAMMAMLAGNPTIESPEDHVRWLAMKIEAAIQKAKEQS